MPGNRLIKLSQTWFTDAIGYVNAISAMYHYCGLCLAAIFTISTHSSTKITTYKHNDGAKHDTLPLRDVRRLARR